MLPPPPVPAPPAGPLPPPAPSSSGRRWGPPLAGVLLLVSAAIVLSVAVAGSNVVSKPHGPHAFLETLPDGSPYRWNPCQAIHYVVNPKNEPQGAAADVREAIRRVSAATGIRFVYDGTTVESAEQQIGGAFLSDVPGPRWLPVLIAFEKDSDFSYIADTRRAAAIGMPDRGDGALAHEYVSGAVIVDVGAGIPTGFGTRYAMGPILMHELGHVMGLAHVGAGDEVMWSPLVRGATKTPDINQVNWGPGDLEGLRALGRPAGCLPPR